MGIGPSMQWLGSSNPDQKSGKVTFFYPDINQQVSLNLPDFSTAFALEQFIQTVYQGGKSEGAKNVQFAIEHVLREVVK